MKLDKTILVGIIFILFAGVIFITDAFNPIIRPVTYLFLMGSSKGKDIIFFGLMGLFLILSQASKILKKDINQTKYLKISIILGSALLISGIILEIVFRVQMGIGLNNVFCSMNNGMSSTSIIHTHLLKAVLGEILTLIMGPFIQTGINTGVGLYPYIPQIANIVIIIIPILFILLVLALQKRSWLNTIFISFFSTCLIIGSIDGGMFATPSMAGICGLYVFYRNGYYFEQAFGKLLNNQQLLDISKNIRPTYQNKNLSKARFYFNRVLPYIVIFVFIALRISICMAGSECDYYTVDIVNAKEDVDLGNINDKVLNYENNTSLNKTTYHIDPSYNEMQLINDLKVPLKDKCDYYTVSWNFFTYVN